MPNQQKPANPSNRYEQEPTRANRDQREQNKQAPPSRSQSNQPGQRQPMEDDEDVS